MDSVFEFSKAQARALMLECLGLAAPPRHKAGMTELLAAIRRIHQCQIDSISVAARAHLHILFSRIGSFDPSLLDEALAQGFLFEYFAHAMCFLPIADYPIWRRDMLDQVHINPRFRAWAEANSAAINAMRQHLLESGPVCSSDFETQGKRGLWWDWKLEKTCLEYLFYIGELMISERRGFQRVYALREQVLPNWSDAGLMTADEALQAKIRLAAQALGIASPAWLADYFYLKKTPVNTAIQRLCQQGALLPAKVKGFNGQTFYVAAENLGVAEEAAANGIKPRHATLLSMFDPLIHNRKRARELFDFDYTIEMYTPASKRIYGYYVLPLLVGNRIMGRVDLKAWRKEGFLEAISIHLEPGIRLSKGLVKAIAKALNDYRVWIGLKHTKLSSTQPSELLPLLSKVLLELEDRDNTAN
jgi:uncharacterized protein YcaQ